MDPHATLRLWIEAYRDNDREAMQEHADNYNTWIANGGFPVGGSARLYGLSANFSEGAPMSPWGYPDDPAGDSFANPEDIFYMFGV